MKKKIFKIFAGIMSVIMILMSASLSGFAVSGEDVPLNGVDGCDISYVAQNESATVMLVAVEDKETEIQTLATTKDGINYEVMDISELIPETSNYAEIIDYAVKGDTFVFMADLYKIIVTDTSPDGENVAYDYIFNGSIVLTTTDFVDYKTYPFTLNQDNDDIYNEFDRFFELADFGFVGDTLVYANTDYMITRETDYAVYGKGVYYTTTDFVNWNVCYTPEIVLFEYPHHDTGLIIAQYYNIYSVKYNVLNNGLVFDLEKTEVEEIPYGERTKTYFSKSYATNDFENFTKVFDNAGSMYEYECGYAAIESQEDSLFMIKSYMIDAKKYFEIVKADYTTGNLLTCYRGDGNYSTEYFQTADSIYFAVIEAGIGSKLYCLSDDLKYTLILSQTEYEGYKCKVVNDKLYASYGNELYIFADGIISEYRFQNEENDTEYLEWVAMNDKLLALYKNKNDSVIYARDEFIKVGDVDSDEEITSGDALKILRFTTGIEELSDEMEPICDVNADLQVNSSDALCVLQQITGIVNSFI